MLAHKAMQAGYYWPSMNKDSARAVKHCDKCQKFSRIMKTSPEKLIPIISPWPFVKCGLDIVGTMPHGKGSRTDAPVKSSWCLITSDCHISQGLIASDLKTPLGVNIPRSPSLIGENISRIFTPRRIG
jgi:hypothetical protein